MRATSRALLLTVLWRVQLGFETRASLPFFQSVDALVHYTPHPLVSLLCFDTLAAVLVLLCFASSFRVDGRRVDRLCIDDECGAERETQRQIYIYLSIYRLHDAGLLMLLLWGSCAAQHKQLELFFLLLLSSIFFFFIDVSFFCFLYCAVLCVSLL
jgi:hypothetical protein